MNTEYDFKIIGGKLRKIPIYSKNGTPKQTSYSMWNNDPTYPKIGSRYSVIPPISDHKQDKLAVDPLVQGVSDALRTVSKEKLDSVLSTFHRLDQERSGLVTIKELSDVFLVYNIFILGPIMDSLVKKFEVKGGGIDFKNLWKFLEECHQANQPSKYKLNGYVVQPRLTTWRNQHDGNMTADEISLLEAELQRQLATQPLNLPEIKRSWKSIADRQDGTIGFREMKDLCQQLPISRSLLERLLTHFTTNRDSINWRDFLELIEKSLPKKTESRGNLQNKHQHSLKKQISNLTSTHTQTNQGPEPMFVQIRGRKVYSYPPDELIGSDLPSEPPNEKLALEWVYGYRGRDCRNNLSILQSGELVYFIAAVVVIFDKKANQQRHYTEHTDDIKSMALHPDGVTMATGQVQGHEKVQGEAHIRIWSSESLQTKMVLGLGYFERAVISLAFSVQPGIDRGRYLVSVDDNDYHTISIWDWEKNKKVSTARGHMDQVLMAKFSPFNNRQIVSCGKQHVSFWTLDDENRLKCDRGRFDQYVKPKYITCLTFSKDGDVITGDSNGNIFVWPEDNNQIAFSVKNAHDGPVYSLFILPNSVLLSAGGRDGVVRAWDRRLLPMGVQLKFPPIVSGIRTLVVDQLNNLYAGTVNNSIWCTDLAVGNSPLLDVSIRLQAVLEGHSDDLRGLATHPTSPQFITAGGDKTLKLWNALDRNVIWSARLPAPAQAVDFSPKEQVIAIGHKDGSFALIQSASGDLLIHKRCAKEKISELKFSPDGVLLALASHDNNIYIYKLLDAGKDIDLLGKCSGHTSYVTHIDWSADSTCLQSTSGDYELLFWDAAKCDRIISSEDMRNTDWASQNCVLGYSVLGIWPDGSDGTDINAVERSHSKKLLATADDFGDVKLFRFPCANLKAKSYVAKGHSAHVMSVRFLNDDSRLISVGGRDASVMQWRIAT